MVRKGYIVDARSFVSKNVSMRQRKVLRTETEPTFKWKKDE